MPVLARTRPPILNASRPLAGILFIATLAGCSLVEDRSERYVNAPEGQAIELPGGENNVRLAEAMPIRNLNTDDSRRLYPSSVPKPPDMTSDILDENYVIEELDGRVWLLVNEVPGRLWPAVQGWMNESGLGVAYDSPQLGVQQSELANFSKRSRQLVGLSDQAGADEPRIVVQTRLAPGIRRKTTEIRVRQRELEQSPDGLMAWQDGDASSQQLDQQKALLADLGAYLQGREDNQSVSRVASGMVAEPRVRLLSSDDDVAQAITLELDYGRSWAELNRSLEEIGAQVQDLNRSEGWLKVDFRTEDERTAGWFAWFSDASEPRHTHTVRIEQENNLQRVTAEQVGGYEGELTASDLLTQLFDHLY
ncbi:MAG: outer membrane protein assembly factor BamC [Alteromonadaceae bacterium]|nr:outer membrane protein assembly factor BamC [Alteromonadaceae bacterium]